MDRLVVNLEDVFLNYETCCPHSAVDQGRIQELVYLVSMRPNYFMFMGYLKTGGGGGDRGVGSSETPEPHPPLDPPL